MKKIKNLKLTVLEKNKYKIIGLKGTVFILEYLNMHTEADEHMPFGAPVCLVVD